MGLNPISSNSKNIKNYDNHYTVKNTLNIKKFKTILKKLNYKDIFLTSTTKNHIN